MSLIYKILGQVTNASSEEIILTVPDSYGAVLSGLYICNTGANATYTVTITAGGGSPVTIINNAPIDANNDDVKLKGLTLSNADVIKITASTADVKFNLFGVLFPQDNVYIAP